jgi:hypothetical protein
VSHARVAIIADLCIVVCTGRCHGARYRRRVTCGAGASTGSTRSPRGAASAAGGGERRGLRRRGRLSLVHGELRVGSRTSRPRPRSPWESTLTADRPKR